MKDSVTWKIGGEAGFGIMSSGTILARAFSRAGYCVFATNEYPSLIRGGHNIVTVRIATREIHALEGVVDILMALNQETVDLHKQELHDGSIVVFDPKDYDWQASDFSNKPVLVPVPLRGLVEQGAGEPVMRNTIALGVTVGLLGVDFILVESVIHDQFTKKGDEVVRRNLAFARSGYDFVKTNLPALQGCHIAPTTKKEDVLVLSGSEAVGLGAVRAGMRFAAIYPMTPINSLITFLADHAKELRIVYKQPEDEIAGINMAIGASIAGVRSMVATSGGGFALMVEGLSLAGMVEAPLVIDLGMRVGPATGMPTWTEQGELQFVIHAGHGEFPRVVLAPADAAEAYTLTIEAFQLADKYQVPVFLLTDKYINESQWCVPKTHFQGDVLLDRGKIAQTEALASDVSFSRYSLGNDDGISPRSFPGQKHGQYFANSYEHNEVGHVSEEPMNRKAMVQKRLKKLSAMSRDILPPSVYGDPEAGVTCVTWGSTRGPVLEALERVGFAVGGTRVNVVHFSWIYPFPAAQAAALLSKSTRIIDVEQNATGQLSSLIREHTGILIQEKLLKYDGRPFFPEEILDKVQSVK